MYRNLYGTTGNNTTYYKKIKEKNKKKINKRPWPCPLTEAVTGTETVAESVSVAVCRGRGRVRIVLVIPIQPLTPHHHTSKGPGCAPDGPYDEPGRPKRPF